MSLIYKLISLFILLVICVFAVALAVVNTEAVNFNYYLQEIQIKLSLLLVFSFITGVFMTLVLMLPTLIKLKFLSRKIKVEKNKASAQLKLVNPGS
ncbi:MAG: LapA family protein [Pseudomonadota bacterium]